MLLDSALKTKIESPRQKSGDSNLKSFLKSLSWRIVGTLDTILISYLITGDTRVAFSIGSIEVISKLLLYYLHERAWANVNLKSGKS